MLDRRDFINKSAIIGTAITLLPSYTFANKTKRELGYNYILLEMKWLKTQKEL